MTECRFWWKLLAICSALVACGAHTAWGQSLCEPHWLFGSGQAMPGVDNAVRAATEWDPDGDGPLQPVLVIGGYFSVAGEGPANRVAVWDGSEWSSLGSGMDDTVYALEVYNGQLIAGGGFTSAGGSPVNRIARWDGTGWQPLHLGLRQSGIAGSVVNSLRVYQGELIAAGVFTTAGYAAATGVARWDGTVWRPLGTGLSDYANAMCVHDGQLIVGGGFTSAGGTAASFIAAWDGTQWQPLGPGFSAAVKTLGIYNGELVAGGAFSHAGDVRVNYIATWNGESWRPMGAGLSSFPFALETYAGELFVGGEFQNAGGLASRGLARWDGSAWHAVGSGVNDNVWALKTYRGELFAAGRFVVGSTAPASYLMRWNGSAWRPVGRGITGPLGNLAIVNEQLIGTGAWVTLSAPGLAQPVSWDGVAWTPIGIDYPTVQAVRRPSNAPVEYNGQLWVAAYGGPFPYFAELFRLEEGVWRLASPRISATDATSPVVAMTPYQGKLVVAGRFSTVGSISARSIAAWDGLAWSPLGAGVAGSVAVLRVVGNDLIVGGAFDSTSGGVRLKAIARWNGASWAPIGGLFDGNVRDVEVYRGELIATGWFPTVEGIAVNHIARWDGTAWRPLGAGLESDSLTYPSGIALAVCGDELIVAGRFQRAGGVPTANIARWDGQAWHSMGSGLTGSTVSWVGNEVKDLAVYRGELIVAGEFILADGRPSPYWARWTNSNVPGIAQDPRSVNGRDGEALRLESRPLPGYESVVVRWSRDGVDVVDGPGGASTNGGLVQGASYQLASPTDGTPAVLTIFNAQPSDSGTYVAVFSSECGSTSSTPAVVTVCCRPDVDCSGGVDGDDVIAFFIGWNAGQSDADFDQNGTVDGDDVITFFEHWDNGC